MSKLCNRPAFPPAGSDKGMTLREYYIGQALEGELSANGSNEMYVFEEEKQRKLFARRVITAADAVLELLEQEQTK